MCVCASVSYAYMCVCLCELCTPHAGRSLQKPEEEVRSPGTEVAGGSELPCGCCEPNLGSLQDWTLNC